MKSYLITYGNPEERLKQVIKLIKSKNFKEKSMLNSLKKTDWSNHPDILLVEPEPSIGINKIRNLQMFLSRKPYQADIKIAVLLQAEMLTIPAQNAFLKTLEEPPKNSLIILCLPNQGQLLPTIISRCQLIKLKPQAEIELESKTTKNHLKLLNKIIKSNAGKRLVLIEPYTKSREEAVTFLKEIIFVLRKQLSLKKSRLQYSKKQLLFSLKAVQKYLDYLEANINVRLALESLAISLP